MTDVVLLVLWVAIAAAALPTFIIGLEIFSFLIGGKRPSTPGQPPRGSIAILIPAHNERLVIEHTIASIKKHLAPTDRTVVVADNCTDDTAAIARQLGCEVSERIDSARRGKGYALAWGIDYLAGNPPSTVIILDADCLVTEGSLGDLAILSETTGRPVQAKYLMHSPEDAGVNYQVAEFAWLVKNFVRPQGLSNMGLPCQLTGSGMSFPWTVIRAANLETGAIVEDMQLGLDLAGMAKAPLFYAGVGITSTFAKSSTGQATQRQRWEHGHLSAILTIIPKRLWKACLTRNMGLLALALDLLVPPIALFVMLLGGLVVLSAAAIALTPHAMAPLMVSLTLLAIVGMSLVLAWWKTGRDILPARSIYAIVKYLSSKVPLYWAFFSGRRASRWIRTDRE